MRDYIAWYLIELRRHLRCFESKQQVEDLVLESRNHLQESIDEMVKRGIPEDAATKSAIADFGDPATVAKAIKGEKLAPKVYWVLVGLIVLLAVPTLGQVALSATDDAMGWIQVRTTDFAMVTVLLFFGVFVLALISRKWCSVPIVIAGVLITGILAGTFATKANAYALRDGDTRFVLLSRAAAKGQADARQEWLNNYDRVVPAIQSSLAHIRTSGDIVTLVKQGDYYLYPDEGTNVYRGWPFAGPDIPAVTATLGNRRWIALQDYDESRMRLDSTVNMDKALTAWRYNGSAYLSHLSQQRALVALELERFKSPAKVDSMTIASRLIYAPMAIVLLYGVIAVLLNGLTIAGIDLVGSIRRRNWRRQLN